MDMVSYYHIVFKSLLSGVTVLGAGNSKAEF